jgi:DNA-binding transcriptional regulator YdaS (Cro superfamily)
MNATDPLQRAIDLMGLTCVARECKVSHQAVRKWQRARRMPRTEWTRETSYSEAIESMTRGQVTREELLSAWPQVVPLPEARRAA